MVWIAAAIIFVGFLFTFPRLVLFLTVTAGIIFLVYFSYIRYSDYRQETKIAEERANVTASIEYDSPLCNEQYPVLVKINNGTDKDIVKTKFKLILKRDGHSDTIDYANYLTDKIFPPHTSSYICKHFNVPQQQTPAPQKNEQANWWDKDPLTETQPKKPNWLKDAFMLDNSDNANEWVTSTLGKQPASNGNNAFSNGYKIVVELVDIKFQN